MPTLTRYRQFDGRHWETGSVHNALAYRGVKAPQYSSTACLETAFPTCVNSALDHSGKRRHQSTFSGHRFLSSWELLRSSAMTRIVPTSTKETLGLV
ncbi:MAG: hypothetical protein HGB05_05930 [Chloroflexi bacterium]|nr:hypothetical protein [Chloroflexota bacterium]